MTVIQLALRKHEMMASYLYCDRDCIERLNDEASSRMGSLLLQMAKCRWELFGEGLRLISRRLLLLRDRVG